MVIDRNCWHARLYAWWLLRKHGHSEQTSVNLCPYVRAVLFWGPLRFLFLTKMGWFSWTALAGAAEYGLWRVGGMQTFQVEGVILLVCLGAVAIIATGAGIFWLGSKTKDAKPVRSFGRVLVHRYEKVHEGICPVVHIR